MPENENQAENTPSAEEAAAQRLLADAVKAMQGQQNQPASEGQNGDDDRGYPENTPVAEMTDKQAAAYWKAQSRKHEGRVKQMADYDQLKTAADEYQKLVEASKTDQEKAIDAARSEAREAALKEVGSRLVEAQFTVATAGRLGDEQRTALLGGLDLSRFLTADGSVDAEKVKSFVDSVAPTAPSEGSGKPTRVDLGQGSRGGNNAPTTASGAELYAQRHKKSN